MDTGPGYGEQQSSAGSRDDINELPQLRGSSHSLNTHDPLTDTLREP